ncbi:MAG: type II toxin-antitoxin system PemK/MazF family toxin [Candidatus Gracilibacteria bacterium]|nr:type II toxin-antitoxin system PemK/MazF family toxin [Candidatus Gracilibacteria bacterium]
MYKTKLNRILNLIENIKNDINLPIITEFLEWFLEKIDIHFNKNTPDLKLNKGDIYFVNLGKNIGGELNKIRPCVIYSGFMYNNGNTTLIIPLKSYKGKINNNFNTFINHSKINHLKMDSISDLCGLKQISKKRIKGFIGNLEIEQMKKIDTKLSKILDIKK